MEIRELNQDERRTIATALTFYIAHKAEKAWAQKIILEEMLDDLLWVDKDVATDVPRVTTSEYGPNCSVVRR